jgi:hypothetical protein
MSTRDMWKMFHLLNNTSRDGLTREELRDAGVDCYSDTLMELASRGGVARNGLVQATYRFSARHF